MGKTTLTFIIFLLVATLGALVFIKNPRPYKIAWASIVLNNKEHFMLCDNLPFYPQVETSLVLHRDVVDKLKKIEGVVDVKPVLNKCYTVDGKGYYNKGDILIDYKSRQARQDVAKLIGDNFFGIPYRGHKQ
jgi:hypothetical protein